MPRSPNTVGSPVIALTPATTFPGAGATTTLLTRSNVGTTAQFGFGDIWDVVKDVVKIVDMFDGGPGPGFPPGGGGGNGGSGNGTGPRQLPPPGFGLPISDPTQQLPPPPLQGPFEGGPFGGNDPREIPGPLPVVATSGVTNKDGMPITAAASLETRIKCPSGYVAVTDRNTGARGCMLKGVAIRMGMWKASPKPPISVRDWNALKTADRVAKKLENIAKKAINIQNLKKRKPAPQKRLADPRNITSHPGAGITVIDTE